MTQPLSQPDLVEPPGPRDLGRGDLPLLLADGPRIALRHGGGGLAAVEALDRVLVLE